MLDYYNVMDMMGDEERQVQSSARDFLDAEAAPDIADYWERGEFPKHLIPKLGEMGYFGANLPIEYGAAGGEQRILRLDHVRTRTHRLRPPQLRQRSGRAGHVSHPLLRIPRSSGASTCPNWRPAI